MKDCVKKLLLPSAMLVFFASSFFGSCTTVDDELGLGLLPGDQVVVFSEATLDGINSYMAFKENNPVNQLNMMALGKYKTDGFGQLNSGAVLQFVPSSFSDGEDFFGYEPYLDTVRLILTISNIYGKTDVEQTFNVYPLKEYFEYDKHIDPTEDEAQRDGLSDTELESFIPSYYQDFDVSKYADLNNVLFTFTMKDEELGTVTKELTIEPGGRAFLDKLAGVDFNELYNTTDSDADDADVAFRKFIYGVYIAPAPGSADDAALYIMSPLTTMDSYYYLVDQSYFWISGHNHYKPGEDPDEVDTDDHGNGTMAIDTLVWAMFSFDDTYIDNKNTSIMVLDRDYSSATEFNTANFIDPATFVSGSEPSNPEIYVQGLLGVTGYLDFGQGFLDQLQALRTVNGQEMALDVNKARLILWTTDDGAEYFDKATTRLGMYLDYTGRSPEPILDYNYVYENLYGYDSGYLGYLSRDFGYYEMDITRFITHLANNPDETEKRIWLAPGVTSDVRYTPTQVGLQNPGPAGGVPDPKRMQLKLTYTLLKKTIE